MKILGVQHLWGSFSIGVLLSYCVACDEGLLATVASLYLHSCPVLLVVIWWNIGLKITSVLWCCDLLLFYWMQCAWTECTSLSLVVCSVTVSLSVSGYTVVSRMVFPGNLFPGKSFPGWTFSRIGRFPDGHFPGKTFPGWSFSRMISFPERLREW